MKLLSIFRKGTKKKKRNFSKIYLKGCTTKKHATTYRVYLVMLLVLFDAAAYDPVLISVCEVMF